MHQTIFDVCFKLIYQLYNFFFRSSTNQFSFFDREVSRKAFSTMAVNGSSTHQNGQNGVHSFSGPPRYAPAMYAIPIEQPVVTLDAKSAFQVGTLDKITFYQKHIVLLI